MSLKLINFEAESITFYDEIDIQISMIKNTLTLIHADQGLQPLSFQMKDLIFLQNKNVFVAIWFSTKICCFAAIFSDEEICSNYYKMTQNFEIVNTADGNGEELFKTAFFLPFLWNFRSNYVAPELERVALDLLGIKGVPQPITNSFSNMEKTENLMIPKLEIFNNIIESHIQDKQQPPALNISLPLLPPINYENVNYGETYAQLPSASTSSPIPQPSNTHIPNNHFPNLLLPYDHPNNPNISFFQHPKSQITNIHTTSTSNINMELDRLPQIFCHIGGNNLNKKDQNDQRLFKCRISNGLFLPVESLNGPHAQNDTNMERTSFSLPQRNSAIINLLNKKSLNDGVCQSSKNTNFKEITPQKTSSFDFSVESLSQQNVTYPNFQIKYVKYKKRDVERLFVKVPGKKAASYYEYGIFNGKSNSYYCLLCTRIQRSHRVTAKIQHNDNGEQIVVMSSKPHICEPKKLIPPQI